MVSMSGALRRFGVGCLAAASVLAGLANASPLAGSLEKRAAAGDRLVFCHFMIGIVGNRNSASEYDDDMRQAKAAGIDAFALNIGVDPYTDQQLNLAYESAARNGMKVFISFDFNWYHTNEGQRVGQKIAQYASKPAQLYVEGRVFASSFAGDGVDVDAMRAAAGSNVYWVPNFHPGQSNTDKIDGALNWMGWDNDGNNKAPKPGRLVSVEDGDNAYQNWLGNKKYLAPVSPWFFTHFGPEVPFSKNWVFPGGSLIFDRWNQVLKKGFPMVEIVTWNDYGEAHYMGPLSSKHYDDGNSKWTNDMPHNAWLDLSKPYIAAYKAKDTSVNKYIEKEQIIYWYRRHLKDLNCDSTDTTSGRPANNDSGNYFMGRPDGWQTMDDVVYVVSLLKQAGTITVGSGPNAKTENAPAGAHLFTIPAGLGKQKFALSRNGQNVFSDTSLMDISAVCPCGLYNYNPYAGSVPAGFNDPLEGDGLASLTAGLHVSTCQAKPSLGTNPAVPTGPTNPPPVTTTPGTPPPTTTKPGTPPPTNPPTNPPGNGQVCVAGQVAKGESGNFTGLCSFTCRYGYCPPGPCECTAYGAPISPPASNGRNGCPAAGLPDSYKGLCSYTCNHGYCPETACKFC